MNKKSKAESKEKKPKNSAEDVKLSRVFYHYWKFARKYKWQYFLMTIGFVVGSILLSVINPLFYKKITNLMNTGASFNEIWSVFLIIIVIVILANIFFRVAEFLMVKYQLKGMLDLDDYTFVKTTQHSSSFFEDTFVGSLVNKLNKFIKAYESIMDIFVFGIFFALGQIIVVSIILFSVNFKIALIFLVWFFVYFIISIFLTKKQLVLDYEKTTKNTKRNGVLADAITNVFNIKTFAARKRERKYYQKFINETGQAVYKSWTFHNIQMLINATLFLILEFVAIGLALKLWSINQISIGDVILVQVYFALYFSSLWQLSRTFKNLITAISDAKEMVSILDQPVEVQDIKNAKKLKVEKGEIIFKDTTFSYPNQKENVFHKFNLKIPAGQTLGLVGTSGAGKTTITKLLLRFSNLKSGKILIDGQDISEVTQDSLRSSIAYVPQEPVLFHRSIYENIAYANPTATKEEVMEASQKAHVDEFVQTLENGYDTMVGERGVKLSGGQKQRVAVARAFLKNAPILVLDEATSALDSVSEEFIQDALFKLMKDKTVIVVAHRLSTIQRLDRILVIEDGIIEEDGSHEELLRKKGKYAEFWGRQTRKK